MDTEKILHSRWENLMDRSMVISIDPSNSYLPDLGTFHPSGRKAP